MDSFSNLSDQQPMGRTSSITLSEFDIFCVEFEKTAHLINNLTDRLHNPVNKIKRLAKPEHNIDKPGPGLGSGKFGLLPASAAHLAYLKETAEHLKIIVEHFEQTVNTH